MDSSNKIDKAVLNNLINMIKDDEHCYDKGIAQYLIDRSTASQLENEKITLPYIKNYNISTNIWGLVNHTNRYGVRITDDSYTLKCRENLEKWAALLPVKQEKAEYHLTKSNGVAKGWSTTVSFNGLYAIRDLPEWYKSWQESPEKFKLNEADEMALTFDLIENTQEYSEHAFKNNMQLSGVVLDIMKPHMKTIQKIAHKTPDEMLAKLLDSDSFKKIIQSGNHEKMKDMFDSSMVKSILKKALIKTNTQTNPALLSEMLPFAPPEDWINAYMSKKEFNLLGFFKHKVEYACGGDFNDCEKRIDKTNTSVKFVQRQSIASYIMKELGYLAPALKLQDLSDETLKKWYSGVFMMGNKELYLMSRGLLELPDQTNPRNYSFYDFMKTEKFFQATQSWLDIEHEIQAQKLEEILPVKSSQSSKKLKV